jgi:hypothetical protein
MAIAYRGSHAASTGGTDASAVTVDLSNAGAVAGDFAILVCTANANTESWSLNRSGWTELGEQTISNTLTADCFYKVLTSQDITDDTVTATKTSVNTGATRCAAGVIVSSGVDATTPLDPVATNPTITSQSAADTTFPFAAIDPTNTAFMVVVQGHNGASSMTGTAAPAGWTERFDAVTTASGSTREAAVFGQTYNSNPTSASVAGGNTTPNAASFGYSWTFALAPAAEDPPGDGTATGSFSFSGAASGARAPKGSATGTLSFSGAASGASARSGSATGTWQFSGAAAGGQPANEGEASGALSFSGLAAGVSTRSGSASGTWDFTGSAAGEHDAEGGGSGSVSFSGAASGEREPKGSGSGGLAFSGTASGVTDRSGSATGTLAWFGLASSSSIKTGSGTGSYAYAGAATGTRQPKGGAGGSYAYAGSAAGQRSPTGLASGAYAYAGQAAGSAAMAGAAAGTLDWAGAAFALSVDTVTPRERVVRVRAMSRAVVVARENRLTVVRHEDRTRTMERREDDHDA